MNIDEKEVLNIHIDEKISPQEDSLEMPERESLLGSETLDKSKQLLRDISSRFSRFSKDGFVAALSSIGASRKAGKKAVLKMEIALRRRKMKALFSELGEAVYIKDNSNHAPTIKDSSTPEVVDELNGYVKEINEIQQYIDSLDASNDTQNNRITTLDSDPEEIIRHTNTSVELQENPDLSAYANALQDENVQTRIKALKELFKFDGVDAIAHLTNALKDNNAEIRRKAALYLGWKMAVSAAPHLIKTADDKNSGVRRASLEALGELGTKEAVSILIKSLDDRDYEIRKTAYKSLTKITNEFIQFNPDGSLSDRFKSMQKWEKWWQEQSK